MSRVTFLVAIFDPPHFSITVTFKQLIKYQTYVKDNNLCHAILSEYRSCVYNTKRNCRFDLNATQSLSPEVLIN